MTCAFEPFGGGSRPVSLWDMLRFHADKFVEILNILNTVEGLMAVPQPIAVNRPLLRHFHTNVQRLEKLLQEMNLQVSAKKANQVHVMLTNVEQKDAEPWGVVLKRSCEELRERIAHELEGKAFYYISDRVHLLSDSPLFGDEVDRAFPSAQYDISESGRCLALRRSTACVVHLMRALEVALASLANALGMTLAAENWNTILNDIETEIRSRTKATHGQAWKDRDEPFFAEAAAHLRFIKNGWRNHAMHRRQKYTDEEAEAIYESGRSFMRHLSQRLSEEGLSS